MENVLIIDTETTGIDPSKGAKLIEVGAILFNIEHRTILQQISSLFPSAQNEAEGINQIKAEATLVQMPTNLFVPILSQMADHAGALVAHNAIFDKKFLSLIAPRLVVDRSWICTKSDFKWPQILARKRLKDVCEALQVPYEGAHRALEDCRLIAECFKKVLDLPLRLRNALQNSFGNGSRFR